MDQVHFRLMMFSTSCGQIGLLPLLSSSAFPRPTVGISPGLFTSLSGSVQETTGSWTTGSRGTWCWLGGRSSRDSGPSCPLFS